MKKLIFSILLFSSLAISQPGISNIPLQASQPPGINVQNAFFAITLLAPGTAGSTTAYYHIVTNYPIGLVQPSGPLQANNIPSTVSVANFVTISWSNPYPGAPVLFTVLKTTTPQFPGTCTACAVVINTASLSVTDNNPTLSNFTFSVAAARANEKLQLNNRDWVNPYWEIINNQNTLRQLTVANVEYSVFGNVTVANVNAGNPNAIILQNMDNRQVNITHFILQAVGGSTSGCTAIEIADNSGTVGVSVPIASLTSGTIVNEATSGITLTTFLAPLGANQGLQIIKTGGSCATATSFNYEVNYTIQ